MKNNIQNVTHHLTVTQRVPLVKQELHTLSRAPVMFCRSFVVLLPFFLLAIVLSVLLRFTATGNTFVLFRLIIHILCNHTFRVHGVQHLVQITRYKLYLAQMVSE